MKKFCLVVASSLLLSLAGRPVYAGTEDVPPLDESVAQIVSDMPIALGFVEPVRNRFISQFARNLVENTTPESLEDDKEWINLIEWSFDQSSPILFEGAGISEEELIYMLEHIVKESGPVRDFLVEAFTDMCY